jgi:hypothetical protein
MEEEGDFERLNTELVGVEDGNEYRDDGVSAGRRYWYRVGGVDEGGEWMSETVSIVVPAVGLALEHGAQLITLEVRESNLAAAHV